MKRIYGCIPLLGALLFCIPFASAQSSFDLNIGFGAAHSPAAPGGIDNLDSVNALGSCDVGSADPFCERLPALKGFFMGLGGDLMLWQHFGVGAEVNFQPGHPDYGPLQYRQTFYDFNGIYQPIATKRVALRLLGGIGGARTSFSLSQSGCVGTAVCNTQVVPVGNESHFQLHLGAGVQIYIRGGLFIRPQFDYRYVPGLTDQFGSNSVAEGMVWIGYSFGH